MTHQNSAIYDLMPHMAPGVRIAPFIPAVWDSVLKSSGNRPAEALIRPESWLDRGKDILFTESGRAALLACLKDLNLSGTDEVLIVKNTDGKYISGCVTKTIESVCRWSQALSPATKAVLVIHEFGFPCPVQKFLPFKEMGLPILEDCAYAIGTRLEKGGVGRWGDYALYSLTKYYPIPFGGILISTKRIGPDAKRLGVSSDRKRIIHKTLSGSRNFTKVWNAIRRENWKYFSRRISRPGFGPYFQLPKKVVPGVFLVKVPESFPADKVKQSLVGAGVEATRFYHQGGFYFPVHQFLTDYEKKYILHYFSGS